MRMLGSIAAFVVGFLVAGMAPVTAQDYPTESIRFIAPYNPGGSYDTVARLIGEKLSEKLNQPVVIENRPGAGSLIGTEMAANADPDGHTIVIFGNNHAILPAVHTTASFSVQDDFDPIALVATVPALLLVNPSVEAENVQELIELAKANPGQLNHGSGGNGSATHLAMEMFKFATDTEIVHIPYQAGVPATMDLIAGQTQVGILDIVSARAHVEGGKLRPLSTTTKERSAFFPDVPTIVEAGVPDYEYVEWYGIVTPAGAPESVIEKLNSTITEIMTDPEVIERLEAMGATPMASTPEEFATFLENEIEKNAEAVERAGVTID